MMMKRKNKISSLKEIVNEIESISAIYRKSDSKEARKCYNQYIGLIILDASKSQQYNLNDYWIRLIR